MTEFLTTPLFRLSLLFTLALVTVMFLRKSEPAWKIALIRAAFIGGLLLFLVPLSGFRWELPAWRTEVPNAMPENPAATSPAQASLVDSKTNTPTTDTLPITNSSKRMAFTPMALALWLTGAAILLVRLTTTFLLERQRLQRAGEASPDLIRQWKSVSEEMGIASTPVVTVPQSVSPHLSLNGTLVLPECFCDGDLTEAERRHVLRHEAAHLKAGDHYWFPLLAILTVMVWFHPMAWWLRSRHLVACEEARDAEAARLGGSAAYRSSVAKVALGLIPSSCPSPGLIRKRGRLMDRLNRVEDTMKQSPPLRTALITIQTLIVALAVLIASVAPTLQAASSSDQLLGLWRAVEEGERFARQVEVYEWGGEMKLRIWYATGNDASLGSATVVSFDLSRDELDQELASDDSISVNHADSFSTSIYTLEVRRGELQFQVVRTYTDNSGRGTREHTSYYVPGKWEDFASTF